jgi:alpha-tubulin suppressor-like RCC1 family protein
MATQKGVWDVQEVRDKQLLSEWEYSAPEDPGALYTWGYNNWGQDGRNTYGDSPTPGEHRSSPTQVGTDATWKIMMMGNHAHAIKSDGTLWSWGQGQDGYLGLSANTNRSSPTQLPGTDWSSITNTSGAMVAIKTNGTMWAWGNNAQGALGQNDRTQYSSPKQIPGTGWNTAQGATFNTTGQGAGGFIHVKTDGSMWVWGQNQNAQLPLNGQDGNGNPAPYGMSSPTQVGTDTTWGYEEGKLGGSGNASTFNIKTDGSLWAWGRNDYGTLGNNNKTNYSSPIQIGTDTTWKYVAFGGGSEDYSQHSAIIKTDGTLWCWGKNDEGNLGHNNLTDYSSPKQVGTDTTWDKVTTGYYTKFATKTDGTFWAWGRNYKGGLGQNQGPSNYRRSSPTQLPGTDWKLAVSAGVNSAAIKFV